MTYCKDCRTEFMVEADDPCPRCGRYLGGARMGQRAEVALPEQSAQPAAQKTLMDAVREHFGFAQPEPPVAQQAPVPPPAALAPEDASPRPAQQVQTTLDAVADGRVSLFMCLVWAIPVLIGWGLLGLMVFAGSGESIWIWVKWMAGGVLMVMVYTWFAKWHQRVAQTWRPAGESTVSASSPAPAPAPKAALEGEPNRLAEEERTTVDAVANGCASLFARLVLLVVLAIPALIGFAYMMITHWPGGGTPPLMWCLYLSVFVPPFVCLLTPDEELKALLREHPRFWKVWLWWVMPAVALFLSFPGIQSMIKW